MSNDPEIFLNRYLDSRLEELEGIEIKPGSKFTTIMNWDPATCIDSMCEVHRVKARLKKDKIGSIEARIVARIPAMYKEEPSKAKKILRICMENGGRGKMITHANEQYLSFFPILLSKFL